LPIATSYQEFGGLAYATTQFSYVIVAFLVVVVVLLWCVVAVG
jgi:hypothetical protein